jgi:hypothetical protein
MTRTTKGRLLDIGESVRVGKILGDREIQSKNA